MKNIMFVLMMLFVATVVNAQSLAETHKSEDEIECLAKHFKTTPEKVEEYLYEYRHAYQAELEEKGVKIIHFNEWINLHLIDPRKAVTASK